MGQTIALEGAFVMVAGRDEAELACFPVRGALPQTWAQACRKITAAMSTHPEMVSGYGEFDEQLMKTCEGKVITKRGAEGFH